jgi:hypothetical protein
MTGRNERLASRRGFLRRSAGLALGAAAPLLWSTPSEAGKVSKAAMAYRDSPQNGRACSGCVYFQPGANASAAGSCSVVAGSISPHGYCIAFAPKV